MCRSSDTIIMRASATGFYYRCIFIGEALLRAAIGG